MNVRIFSFLCCLCLVASPGVAQDESQGRSRVHPIQPGVAAKSEGERDLRQIVRSLLMLRLREALDLSEERLQALVARHGQFKDRLARTKIERETARKHLRDCLSRGVPDEEIRQELEALLVQEAAIAEMLREMIEESAEDLTSWQSAQLYLFMGDFENFIRDQVFRAKYISRHGQPPGAVAEPAPRRQAAEESLIEELARREAIGPAQARDDDTGMVDLFDGLLMAMLAQALELTPEEAVILFRRIGTYKDQLHELKWQLGNARVDLGSCLERKLPDSILDRKLDDLLLQEAAIAEIIRKLVTEAEKDVGLAKSARLYLFVGDFEEYVMRLLYRAGKMAPQFETAQPDPRP